MSDNFINFKKLTPAAIIPTRATQYSAGLDLYASESVNIVGGNGVHPVRTGIAVQLPPGTYGRIAIRSGLALNQHLCTTAGVIDRDYTGELIVLVYTPAIPHAYKINAGDRFAQLVIEKANYNSPSEIREFIQEGFAPIKFTHLGFGSTGNK
jgi:dUTP pyrophosphatase